MKKALDAGIEKIFLMIMATGIVNIYLLFINFSFAGCITTFFSIAAACYFLFLPNKSKARGIAELFPISFAICTINGFLLSVVKQIESFNMDNFDEYASFFAMCGLAFLVFIILNFVKYKFFRVAKYLLLFIFTFVMSGSVKGYENIYREKISSIMKFEKGFFFSGFQNIYIVAAFIAIVLFVKYLILIFESKSCITGKDNKYHFDITYISAATAAVIVIFVSYIYPQQTVSILKDIENIFYHQWNTNAAIALGILMGAIAVTTIICDKKRDVYPKDSLFCLVAFAHIVLIPIMVCVNMMMAIFSFFFIALSEILMINVLNRTAVYNGENRLYKKFLPHTIIICGLAVPSLFYFGLVYDLFFKLLFAFAAILLLGLFAKVYKKKDNIKSWIAAVTLFDICCLIRVFWLRNTSAYVFYLLCILAVSVVVFFILNAKSNDKYAQNTVYKLIVLLLSVFLMIYPTGKFGANIDIEAMHKVQVNNIVGVQKVNENKDSIKVKIKANGKENKITECYYYWNNDTENAVKIDEENSFTLKPRSGMLKVYCKDSHGVETKAACLIEYKSRSKNTETIRVEEATYVYIPDKGDVKF